jgi:hypothetical protein
MNQTIFHKDGYQMRSHSETRWANAMNVLGITWLYEARTVETRHGWYMPDFYLPFAQMFIEVKGPQPTPIEIEKAQDAEQATGIPVVFAYGRPEMLHGELFHGVLSYFTPKGVASFSTCEIGELVKQYLGLDAFAAFITAGEHQRRPDVFQIGDALEELVSSWQERPDREAFMRGIHAPLNFRKIETHRQLTRSEWLLAEFSTRTANSRFSQEVA